MKFEPTQLHLQKGDIIKSKKGFLEKSAITEEFFLVKEAEYIGNNHWCARKKEPIDIKVIKERKKKRRKNENN